MLNWNLVPLFYGPVLPYCLFTETEWIGKLAYMINNHDEKINTLVETVDSIVNVELPNIKLRLDDLETVEIPGIKSRLDAVELDIDTINHRSWVYVLKVNNPVYEDDNNIRTYTIPIITGYNYANFSCILNADHMQTDSVKSRIPINITIPIGDNVDRTIDILDFAEAGEYGTPGLITNKITFNSDVSFTISYGVDKFINFTCDGFWGEKIVTG